MKIILSVSVPLEVSLIDLAKKLREIDGINTVRIKVNVFIEDYVEVFILLNGEIELDKIREALEKYKAVINYVDEVEM